jgi:predicted Fe-Mo cluster-binding NifX family protein
MMCVPIIFMIGDFMKIAITASGEGLDSTIDPRFGRAKNFIIVDEQTMDFKCIPNEQNINAPSGAGIQAAQIVSKQGAEVLITGNCGPKAFAILDAANIKVIVGVSGIVKDSIIKYKQGELKPTDSSNVEGHWM